MRIGISCYPTFGGSGVVATELAMALADGGDEVHVISYALPSRLSLLAPSLFFHEVVVPHYPLFEYPPYSLALASKMAEVARHQKLDLMHVHYAVPNAISAILAKQILAPQPLAVVTTLHGTDITLVGNDPSYLETTRFGLAQSDAVTAVSDSLRRADRRAARPRGEPHRGDSELHRSAALRRGPGVGRGAALGEAGREDPAPHLELPAGQADHGRARRLPRGPARRCRRGSCWSATARTAPRPRSAAGAPAPAAR